MSQGQALPKKGGGGSRDILGIFLMVGEGVETMHQNISFIINRILQHILKFLKEISIQDINVLTRYILKEKS